MLTKEDYDSVPVLYCKRCLSLCIMEDTEYGDYCRECGSTDIGEATIEEWETLRNEILKEVNYGKGKHKKDRRG